MDQSNHLSTQLEQFIERALEQLKLLGYSKKSLFRYKTTWRHFVIFARQKQMDEAKQRFAGLVAIFIAALMAILSQFIMVSPSDRTYYYSSA